MRRLLAASSPSPLSLVLLALAAVAITIAGFEHALLWHRGYAEVHVVGPLFLLNAIATAIVVLLLVFERPLLFALGAVAICVGSLVSILISHSASFFHFREGGYDGAAKLIVVTEVIGLVLAIAGAATVGRRAPAGQGVSA